jgi:hypothetical protein
LTLASADFGAKSAMAAGVAVFGIECMIKAGQFDAARQALAKVDRTAANTMLNDGYAGETFDLYDAAVAHGLGDDAAARRHLAPLQKYFAANDGNSYHRRWIAELAAALGPQPGRDAEVVTKLPPSAAVH